MDDVQILEVVYQEWSRDVKSNLEAKGSAEAKLCLQVLPR